MKLHLPKKFQTALMAAIATVSFSTVSTATLAAAAFTFAGYQAAAEETADAPELTSEEKEAEEKLNEEMEDSIQAQEEEEKEESKLTTHAIDLDAMKNLSNRFERGGDAASHQLAQQAYAAMEVEVFTPEASAAPQQQATATSGELPSDDLGFTASPYATGSTGNSGPVFEVTPAAPAADFLQDSPAENQGSGSTTGATSPAPVSASGFGGGAAGGYSPSGYAAPAVRPLSVSVAPTALAAPASVAAPAAVAAPVEVAAPSPKLAAADAEPPANYIFSFNNGSETVYFTEVQAFYDLRVAEGKSSGTIAFNPGLAGSTLPVEGDFRMTGDQFTINTNGVKVIFDQPLSNYNTDVTVTGNGTIETKGAAAFRSITVGSGTEGDNTTLKIGSQIGVTGDFVVKQGGTLELEGTSHLLLTQQITNAGTIKLNADATLDASNLSHAAAESLGIKFEDTSKQISANGSGFLHGDAETQWEIATGNGTVEVPEEGNAKLVVGNLSFNISEEGVVHHTQTDYSVWFQNGGSSPALSEIILAAPDNKVSIMANAGGDTQTEVVVDGQIRDENVVAITRGTRAFINMTDAEATDESWFFSISNLKIYDMADVTIHGWSGEWNHVNNASFIGQGITLSTIDHPAYLGNEFDPMNLTVENASSATINADIVSAYGYFNGEEFTRKCLTEDHPEVIAGGIEFLSGEYNLRGSLVIGAEHKIDMRQASGTTYYVSATRDKETKAVSDIVFQEEFVHLTMSEQGALSLEDGGVFLASSVSNDSALTEDGNNLDTTRKLESARYKEYQDWDSSWKYAIIDESGAEIDPGAFERYKVNGTVEISSSEQTGKARITATGDSPGHYTTRNQNYLISGGMVKVTDEGDRDAGASSDTTVSNMFDLSSVVNAKDKTHGSLTLDNKNGQSVSFALLYAQEGDIYVTNKENATSHDVRIGASREVAAVKGSSFTQEAQNATLTVQHLLKAEGYKGDEEGKDYYSKIDANLNLAVGVTLDVSAANGTGGIDMQGNVVAFSGEYGDAPLTLSQTDYEQAWAMEKGGMYDLFHDVSAFAMYTGSEPWTDPISEEWQMDASQFFSNLKEGWFYLCYSGAATAGGNGNNVGTIYLYSLVPEPTTGTLSLLALAALAARRRRKG